MSKKIKNYNGIDRSWLTYSHLRELYNNYLTHIEKAKKRNFEH